MPAIRWVLAASLVLLGGSCLGADVERAGDVLVFHGEISSGDFGKLQSALASHGKRPVYLHSPGGQVVEALQIAEFIRAAGLQTHVPRQATCASACVRLLAAGVLRTADQPAKIGIHMGSGLLNAESVRDISALQKKYGSAGVAVYSSKFEQMAALSTLKQVDFYIRAGVSLRLLHAAARVEHFDIRWLTHSEARDFNLLNAD